MVVLALVAVGAAVVVVVVVVVVSCDLMLSSAWFVRQTVQASPLQFASQTDSPNLSEPLRNHCQGRPVVVVLQGLPVASDWSVVGEEVGLLFGFEDQR